LNVNHEIAHSFRCLLIVRRPSQVHERKRGCSGLNDLAEIFVKLLCSLLAVPRAKQSRCSPSLSAEAFSVSLVTLAVYIFGAFFAQAGGQNTDTGLLQ